MTLFNLADVIVPWSSTASWMMGLMGAMTFLLLILMVINHGRKLFGRRPPIDEDLRRLDDSLARKLENQTQQLTRTIADNRSATDGIISTLRSELTKRHEKTETAIEDMNLKRDRDWDKLNKEITDIRVSVATISGKGRR